MVYRYSWKRLRSEHEGFPGENKSRVGDAIANGFIRLQVRRRILS